MGQKPTAIQAKRRGSRISNIRKRVEAGETDVPERALMRLGRANTRLLTGQEDLSTWTDEELCRGQKRDRNGRWPGKKPLVIPKMVHDELVRRTLSRANELLRENLHEAIAVLTAIAKNPKSEDSDRLRAISMIMDRVMGKTPEKIQIGPDVSAWEEALDEAVFIVPDEEAIFDVIDVDGEEVDDDV